MTNLRSDTNEDISALAGRAPRRPRWGLLAAIVTLSAVAVSAWFGTHNQEAKKRDKAAPVTVATVAIRDMPLQMKSIGSVTPINSVAVKSHVAGQILDTHFSEGQRVAKGQLLFTIDPRPLQAALSAAKADVLNKEALVAQAEAAISKDYALIAQAEANKDKSVAIAANSEVEEQRYSFLSKTGAVSKEQSDQARTNAVSASATVKADSALINNAKAVLKADRANLLSAKAQLASAKATLQNAQVQLGYTSITSPIAGVAGNVQILTGNLVRQDTDTLVTINQIDPIFVSLTVPEHEFAAVRQYVATGQVTADAYQSTGAKVAANGQLVFANNIVDPATGTVMLKVKFANSAQTLWPGQFVNVVTRLAVIPNAVIVPSQAVQTGQSGNFVWVVSADKKATMQPVTTGQTIDNFTVITEGLTPGQSVVTDGQLLLTPGASVKVTEPKAAPQTTGPPQTGGAGDNQRTQGAH